jgi:hypothetical protein
LINGYIIGPGVNLSVDLSNADLSNADLSSADLSIANLSNADLSNADLSNANLSIANLSDADLSNADLTNAVLKHANLTGADLTNADLTNITSGYITGTPIALPRYFEIIDGVISTYIPSIYTKILPQSWSMVNASIINQAISNGKQNKIISVWKYDGTQYISQSFNSVFEDNGDGYWINCNDAITLTITNNSLTYTKTLLQSWSMVNASIINHVITKDQQNKIISVWKYDGTQYISQPFTSVLEDNGDGYWINCRLEIQL